MRSEKQWAAAQRAEQRANLRLAKELLDALRRNQADRLTLRRRVRAMLRRVEREGV